jgi:adenylate cyclase
MKESQPGSREQVSEKWAKTLTEGHKGMRSMRWMFRHVPSSPRCKVCSAPFGGMGRSFGFMGFKPSRKNPNICGICLEGMPLGGAEVETAVLFADVRGSTALGEGLDPSEFAALMNRFYKAANEVLLAHDAIVDKLIGDEVMALFVRGVSGPAFREKAVHAAQSLLSAVGYGSADGPWLPMGAGVHVGVAFVGNVGTSEVNDLTALGDTVNTAARLQGIARPGEVVVSESAFAAVAARYPEAESRTVEVKGKAEPLTVRVLPPA